jgi:DNA-binding transcriptional LysR family regulator
VDLDALRTVIAVADYGQFQEAAFELSVTQQAVSKRVAALETELGVRLFTRTPRGAEPTIDGRAFLPHARAVLAAVQRATESVRAGSRALRVDIVGRRVGPGRALRAFNTVHPDIELDIVLLDNEAVAVEAVAAGTVDATFRAGMTALPEGVLRTRVLDDTLDLLTGERHELAGATSTALKDLAGQRIWIPGLVEGAEWTAYYDELAATFGLHIDGTGPVFGMDHMLDVIGESSTLCTFFGVHTIVDWTTRPKLRRIPVRDPAPVYPHALIWRADNTHPGLAALRDYLGQSQQTNTEVWLPSW